MAGDGEKGPAQRFGAGEGVRARTWRTTAAGVVGVDAVGLLVQVVVPRPLPRAGVEGGLVAHCSTTDPPFRAGSTREQRISTGHPHSTTARRLRVAEGAWDVVGGSDEFRLTRFAL